LAPENLILIVARAGPKTRHRLLTSRRLRQALTPLASRLTRRAPMRLGRANRFATAWCEFWSKVPIAWSALLSS